MTDATVLWEACAAAIQAQVSDVVWQMTFNSAQPVTADAETLTVSVPSNILRDRIEGRYRAMVDEAVAEISDDQLSLQIVIREEVDDEPLLRIVAPTQTREPPAVSTLVSAPAQTPVASTRPTTTSSEVPFVGRLTIDSHTPPPRPSPRPRVAPTTRCSSTGTPAWARPTSSRPSATT